MTLRFCPMTEPFIGRSMGGEGKGGYTRSKEDNEWFCLNLLSLRHVRHLVEMSCSIHAFGTQGRNPNYG